MRRILLLLSLAVAGCGRDEPTSPPEKPKAQPMATAAPPKAATPLPPSERDDTHVEDAAAVLRRYYDHIEAGRYREAWAMRSAGEEGLDRFERNFAAYDRYQVTLGHPTQPVEAGGWTYVEVPIQILGTLKGGKGFGSVGNITMRRATGAARASEAQREWHIYTG